MSPPKIAGVIGIIGLAQSLWLLVLMPPLDRRFGTRRLLRMCFACWPWLFAGPVLASLAARRDAMWLAWLILVAGSVFGAGVSMAFSERIKMIR